MNNLDYLNSLNDLDEKIDTKKLCELLSDPSETVISHTYKLAKQQRLKYYGKDVYLRGLIEITNTCNNNCYYCGIRKDNKNIKRYLLTKEDVLSSCEIGYNLGIRSFVIQGGETDINLFIIDLIKEIRSSFKDCAITLSLGEQKEEIYRLFKQAGADRYLLRHETISDSHYKKLHPKSMSLKNRKSCLYSLKKIGFQVGSGFMVGSPFQTCENLAKDIAFLKELNPHMIGIGPFISHKDTPYKDYSNGTIKATYFILALLRIIFKKALIPATTSLETLERNSKISALEIGANVIMPNFTPYKYKKEYSLYDNKPNDVDVEESVKNLVKKIEASGFYVKQTRGDSLVN